jgi:hypothetical protein
MSLKSWAENGWIRVHLASPEELAALVAAADADLDDARNEGHRLVALRGASSAVRHDESGP